MRWSRAAFDLRKLVSVWAINTKILSCRQEEKAIVVFADLKLFLVWPRHGTKRCGISFYLPGWDQLSWTRPESALPLSGASSAPRTMPSELFSAAIAGGPQQSFPRIGIHRVTRTQTAHFTCQRWGNCMVCARGCGSDNLQWDRNWEPWTGPVLESETWQWTTPRSLTTSSDSDSHSAGLMMDVFFFQGRLNELMSQMRMQNQLSALRQDATYQMDDNVQREVKQVRQLLRKSTVLTHINAHRFD